MDPQILRLKVRILPLASGVYIGLLEEDKLMPEVEQETTEK